MGTRDPRVDAYIEKAPEYARPILSYMRQVIHEGCPEVQETIKWSAPFFDHHGVMCGIAAFKEYCAFNFWKGPLVLGTDTAHADSAGQLGRIYTVADLPPREVFVGYIRKAAQLNEEGVKVEKPKREAKAAAEVPAVLTAALEGNPTARAAFDAFSPSQRRDYVEWLTDAKSDATRERRLAQAIEWIAEGKPRHWKYQRK